jgi:hypothetical protein
MHVVSPLITMLIIIIQFRVDNFIICVIVLISILALNLVDVILCKTLSFGFELLSSIEFTLYYIYESF